MAERYIASDSTSISSVIDLNFVPDECIADSVSMVDMFPALNKPRIDELESMGNSDESIS
ncbi:Uncharacterised protein [Serratia liquefaciens]|uniref:hypothetical protein n=1 Tax=Serratia liquefaciens TaxID=614 RepID=UPI002178590C|nr:hypothetical protein [Serratia liquefaciens]CAI1997952.1 Uncharacterised protein [Serratia liquefaciens]